MSCIWTPSGSRVTLSLCGDLNVFNEGQMTTCQGHQAPISRVDADPKGEYLFTAGVDGTVIRWKVSDGTMKRVEGRGHGNQVTGLTVFDSTRAYTTGIDDKIGIID